MTTPPPPETGPGVPDVLAYLFPSRGPRGGKVLRASKVSRETRKREIDAYRRAYPDATPQQAARRTAAMRRRGYAPRVVTADRATPEQIARAQEYQERSERAQQRPPGIGGGIRDYDPVQTMLAIREKVADTFLAEAQREYDKIAADDTTGLLTPGKVTGVSFEFNEQAVIYNMQQASAGDRVWAVESAKGWDIRKRAYDANRRGIESVWFYHGDTVQNGF